MEKKLLVFLLGMAPLVAHSEVISESQAAATAARFFAGGKTVLSSAKAPKLNMVWSGQPKENRSVVAAEPPAFYVFNRGENQGFVVVAGDDAVQPILGYSYEGTFGVVEMPENLQAWTDAVQHRVEDVRSGKYEPTAEVKEAWAHFAASQTMLDLKTPDWNQQAPYNWACPAVHYSDGDWHAYVGCTMTATGIVMGYHQWPEQGQGVLGRYKTPGIDVWIEEVDLANRTYDWKNMPDINGNVLPSYATDDDYRADPEAVRQGNAVAPLLADLGHLFRANYKYTGTTATLDFVQARMPRNMKYHEGMLYVQRKFFSDKVWNQMLTEELDQRRPIVMAGYGMQGMGGHSFVIDGYDSQGLFLVNWGWGGMSNGFFDIDVMHPSHQGAGGTDGGFNMDQEVVMRIQPKRPESTFAKFEDMVFAQSSVAGSNALPGLRLKDSDVQLEQGSTFTMSAGVILNWGSDYYEGKVMVAVADASGKIKEELYTTPGLRSLNPGNAVMPLDEARDVITVTLQNQVEPGDRIRLFYKSEMQQQWMPVRTKEEDVPWEIVLKKADVTPVQIDVKTTEGRNLNGRAVATFSADVSTVPSDATVEAFYAEVKDANTIVLKKIEPVGNQLVVPANTGVVLATSGAQLFTMNPADGAEAHVPSTNLLRPTTSKGIVVGLQENAYILGKSNGEVLFHVLSGGDRKIAAHRSYLDLPSEMNVQKVSMSFDEVTGIDGLGVDAYEASPVYDLSGRLVNQVTKGGIYIQNGKKFIVK